MKTFKETFKEDQKKGIEQLVDQSFQNAWGKYYVENIYKCSEEFILVISKKR